MSNRCVYSVVRQGCSGEIHMGLGNFARVALVDPGTYISPNSLCFLTQERHYEF